MGKISSVKLIKDSIKNLVRDALKKDVSVDVDEITLGYPPDAKQGDITLNCFLLAKNIPNPNKKVMEMAKNVAEYLGNTQYFDKVNAVGPYVNVTLHKDILFKTLCREAVNSDNFGNNNIGNGKTVIVEFSSPNTNKPQHLGHVRNNTIGVAISNLLKANGYNVVQTNLVNDRGIHICKSMVAYQLFGNGETPDSIGKKGDHFVGDWYVKYNVEVQKDPSLEDKAREMLRKFEAGDKDVIALWKKMNGWVYDGFKETYYNFGVDFDVWYFESNTCKLGRSIVEQGVKDGIFYKDEKDAILYTLPEEKFGLNQTGDKKKVTLLRADGTSLYLTQDLGTALLKFDEFKFTSSIYVVGSEQKEHFKYLFHILERLGNPWARDCHHLSYGMVNLPDGKMKSREGKVVDADDLLQEVKELLAEELKKRNNTDPLSKIELEERSNKMANAAVKIFLLKYGSDTTISFNPKESISFEGFTGVYILYAYTRAVSILRKARELKDFFKMNTNFGVLGNEQELILAKFIIRFPEVVESACISLDPSHLVRHIYEIAKAFNQFYNSTPVLGTADVEIRKARLELVKATARVIQRGLKILGVKIVDRM